MPIARKKERSNVEPQIIFQDSTILVLNKPSGWVVNDAETTKNLHTVQRFLQKNFDYAIVKSKDMRSGIVHRLDKETSGVLLVAKTKEAFENLQKQFKERRVEKVYVALVHGKVEPKKGVIESNISRNPWNRKKFGVFPGGREAVTKYKVLNIKHLDGEPYSLLELYPKTGRTHQIRVHLKHIGHPIVSDKTYVGRKTWRHDTKWCPRLFLRAHSISFKHPSTSKKVAFDLEISQDLKDALKTLA